MIEFWFCIAVMTLIAVGFVLWPLWRQAKPAKITGLILLIAIPLFAVSLYWHFGASRELANYWNLKREAVIVKAEMQKIKNVEQLVDQLKAHLQQDPGSAKGWYLLGRLYMGQQHFIQAQTVFNKAYQLEPKNNEYAIAFAEATFFAKNRRLDNQTRELLRQVIQRDPTAISAMNLVAIDAFETKHYHQAIQQWEAMLPLFAVGSPESKMILTMIAKAQRLSNK